MIGSVHSIQIGKPRTFDGIGCGTERVRQTENGAWTSAIIKEAIHDSVEVTTRGIVGDHQVDRRHHGGQEKAVLLYAVKHYQGWRNRYDGIDFQPGAFGENLTIEDLCEDSVCIGDQWQVSDVTLEISQPRQPCWKLARRWGLKELPKEVQVRGNPGWYARVLAEGTIQAGQPIRLLHRPNPDWTVKRLVVMLGDKKAAANYREPLMKLSALSDEYRRDLLPGLPA